ncbi:MAG: hypothetical protein JWM76_4375 [Pseudonocardiales bacterium]|nr:hypothetical protein [Pseudonocardiales bacterium]
MTLRHEDMDEAHALVADGAGLSSSSASGSDNVSSLVPISSEDPSSEQSPSEQSPSKESPSAQLPDKTRAQSNRRADSLRRAWGKDGRGWPPVLIAIFTTVAWIRPVFSHFASARLSNPGDSISFEYYIAWNLHAIETFTDPFSTPNLYAPAGLNLGNAISIPAVSLLVSPVTLTFGATAAYNVAFLLAIFFSAVSVYLLARELTANVIGSTIAGLLMVMSPYFVGHALGHMNLMWVFGLPYLAYLLGRFVKGRLGVRWFVVLTAVTVAFTFGASTELVVTESFFGVVAIVVALLFVSAELRPRLLRGCGWLAVGGIGGVILGLPVIYAALRAGIPSEVSNPPAFYSSDLTNLFAPTGLFRFGESRFAVLWPHWLGNGAENTAYLPLPLIVLLLVYMVASRGRVSAGTFTFAGLALVASFGPFLVIDGNLTIPMPWHVFEQLPGLEHALPGRFSAFVFMAICVLVAQAWSTKALPRVVTAVAVVAAMVLLVPNFAAMSFPSKDVNRSFIASGAYKQVIHKGDNVLVLPAGEWGPGLEWIVESDFAFSMPTGNGGGATRPAQLSDPVGNALFAQDLNFDYKSTLPGFVKRNGVHLVLVPESAVAYVKIASSAFGQPDRTIDGVLVWAGV